MCYARAICQPSICTQPVDMTPYCKDACIICDINGFTGRHESNIPGILPPGFCTTTVHNAQWISFIAGSVNLTIELSVSNCVTGSGLEMTIYESKDCITFKQVFNCDGDVREGTKQVFKNTVPLTIGQYYFLAMDGNGGDNCDWTFKVLEGSTKVLPLVNSGVLSVPDEVCPSIPIDMEVEPPIGGTEFDWTINGAHINKNAANINYTFSSDGVYEVCVAVSNVCNGAPPVCKQMVVKSIPPTIFADTICENECLVLSDTTLCTQGAHTLHYQLANGCDSMVQIMLKVNPKPITNLDLVICNGDSVFIDNKPFFETNNYSVLVSKNTICDSLVNLKLKIIECNINGTHEILDQRCYNSKDGEVEFTIVNGTPPFTYYFKDYFDKVLKSGTVTELNIPTKISGLSIGDYLIEINDLYGNQEILLPKVGAPSALQSDAIVSSFNGVNISCHNGMDGSILLTPKGGSPPYYIDWDNGAKGRELNQLNSGTYMANIADAHGCTISTSIELSEADSIKYEVLLKDPGCDGPNTASIEVYNISGGTGKFTISLDESEYLEDSIFNALFEGIHNLVIKDENGCLVSEVITFEAAEIPVIRLIRDIEIELGDSIDVVATLNNIQIKEVKWISKNNLSCDTCLHISYFPIFSEYLVFLAESKDGCITQDSINVRVNNDQIIYYPNIFNSEGDYNYFQLTGSKGVKDLVFLRVFDRWGNIVYQEENKPISEVVGWDGKSHGHACEEGVYVWNAVIRFLDNTTKLYQSDITLIK